MGLNAEIDRPTSEDTAIDRRTFLTSSVAAGAWSLLPKQRVGDPKPIRVSCNLYSFNDQLRSGDMSLEEVFEYCAELGFDAVDPTGYYFPGYPDPPPDDFIYQIRRKAFVLGLDISGTGVRNNFAAAENPAADIDHVKEWVKVAEKMGAPTVRVFAGEASVGHSEDEVSRWLVDSLKTCAEYGKQHGIMIGLQPHHDFLKTAAQVLDVLERVDSEWVGLNLDVGSLRAGDPYEEIALLMPHAITGQIKERVYRNGNEEKIDLNRIVDIVRRAGYPGYLPLETLGPESAQNLPAFLDEVRQALNR